MSLVGKDIDSFCKKCNLLLAHFVVAMKDDVPYKVQCKTCENQHVHRVPKVKKARKPRAKKKPKRAAIVRRTDYELLIEGRDMSAPATYKINERFGIDDVIQHKKLGLGIVTENVGERKIRVHFPEGLSLLIHGLT